MEAWTEATVERRCGGINPYLAREDKGVDSTRALILALLALLPDGVKRVRITVEAIDD